MEGLSTGLMPFGTIIGDNLPKKASMPVVLLIIGILGVGVTFAEPAIGALQAFGASVDVKSTPYLYELKQLDDAFSSDGWRRRWHRCDFRNH